MDSPYDRPSDEELRLFLERIERRLEEEPPALSPAAHREQVAALLRQSGESSFYEMLSLLPTATVLEVHEAYDRVARLVHPQNARRLGLEGREGVLEVLFERVTAVYLTLSQPDRRKRYDRDLGPDLWKAAGAPAAGQRKEEAREVARRYYERAMELAVADDYYFAIELAQQAVRIDPRPEYHALLGRLQARNPLWLRSAAENLRKALDMGARDVELPAVLQSVIDRLEAGEAAAAAGTAAPGRKRDDPEVRVLDPDATGEIDLPLPGEGAPRSRRRKK
jgi:curved DNA-binding protein CbpA